MPLAVTVKGTMLPVPQVSENSCGPGNTVIGNGLAVAKVSTTSKVTRGVASFRVDGDGCTVDNQGVRVLTDEDARER